MPFGLVDLEGDFSRIIEQSEIDTLDVPITSESYAGISNWELDMRTVPQTIFNGQIADRVVRPQTQIRLQSNNSLLIEKRGYDTICIHA